MAEELMRKEETDEMEELLEDDTQKGMFMTEIGRASCRERVSLEV